jgi:hypothetical protein
MKHETNVEFIVRMMNFSTHGALMHLFIMAALRQYAERVATAEKVNDNGFISGEAWRATAKELLRELNKKEAQ